MTEAAGERFAGLTVEEARDGGGRGARARRAGSRKQEPYTHTVPFSHRSGERDRAADLAAVVHAHGRAGRSRRSRPCAPGTVALPPRALGAACTSTGSRTSGPGASRASCGGGTGCRSGTATPATRPTSAREPPERCGAATASCAATRTCSTRGSRSALWPFATLGWPERHAGAARLLPDRRARHRARHHLPVGRAHGDDGPRVHAATSRSTTSTSPRSSRRPTAAGCRSRSAPASTRSTRSRRTAPTRVRFGLLAMSSSQDVRYSAEKVQQGQQLANKMWNASRLVLLNVAGRRAGAAAARPSRTAGSCRACSARSRRSREQVDGVRLLACGARPVLVLLRRLLRLVPGDGQAAPVRARTARRSSATLLHVLGADARARAPDDAVRDRGDLTRSCPAPSATCAVGPFPQADDVAARRGRRARGRAA